FAGSRPARGDDSDDHGGAGPGRGGPGSPGPDDHDSPGGDPAWWAEFEREFAAYTGRPRASDDGLMRQHAGWGESAPHEGNMVRLACLQCGRRDRRFVLSE